MPRKTPTKNRNIRRSFRRNTKTQWCLHHKLAWVLLLGALSMAFISSLPDMLSAWGPSRPTYTVQQILDGSLGNNIVFNSIRDTVGYGDERGFLNIRDTSCTEVGVGCWKHSIEVQQGHTYEVRMYVHNNSPYGVSRTATNVNVVAAVDGTLGASQWITGFIRSNNAVYPQTWDDINLYADSAFSIDTVPNQVTYFNNWTKEQSQFASTGGYAPLTDKIFTSSGVKLGYNQYNSTTKEFDGRIPGCYEYSGYLFFQVTPNFGTPVISPTNDFTVDKWVRKEGDTVWQKTVNANLGDRVEYQIKYQNIGEIINNNVFIKDLLPSSIDYVANSTYLIAGSNPAAQLVDNDTQITISGENVGNYAPGSTAFVKFTAAVTSKEGDLEVCGKNTLRNRALIWTDYGRKDSTADVVVEKTDCAVPVTECRPGVPEGDPRCTGGETTDLANPIEPETSARPSTPPVIAATGPLAVTAVIFIIAAAIGVTWHHYYAQKNNLKKPASIHVKKKLTPRFKTKSHK